MSEVYDFNGSVVGWDEDAPESGDSDGDLIPPMDGDDSDGADEQEADDNA